MTAGRRAGIAAVLVIACAIARAASAGDGFEAVYDAHYQFEHLGYCGMADTDAQAALDRKVRQAMDAGLSREDMEQARMKAWSDAYKEWLNRGLGGFRAWCADEGPLSKDRLIAD